MSNEAKVKRIWRGIELCVIFLLCALTLALDFFEIDYFQDDFYNGTIGKIIQQACGSVAAILLMRRLQIRLFGKITNWTYLIPCFIIAVDNFQFSAYFQGKMELIRTDVEDVLLFLVYCLFIGLFEELIFRGVLFSVFADLFSKDRKGFLMTYVVSSVVFGLSHLLNGFSGATILQVGYTTLTGGLFAFCLIKTKNIFCCAITHGVYNFCGLLFDVNGLGTGVVFDVGTVVTMLIVSVLVGVFVLYEVWKYSETERIELYQRLGVKIAKQKEE